MSGKIQISPKTRLERLRNARRVMAAVAEKPKSAFDITIWGKQVSPDGVGAPPCGTVACVAGWMGLDPWFQAQGFTFDPGAAFPCPKIGKAPVSFRRYEISHHEVFLSEWLGLTDDEACNLFRDGAPRPRSSVNPTAAEQRDYLDVLIAKYEKVK